MKTSFSEILLDTSEAWELVDLTERVRKAVSECGISEGICLVWSTHTTAAVVISEDEQGLLRDLLTKVREDFPSRGTWLHNLIDDNAHSHLAGSYLGQSVTIPVREGSPLLGEYQSLFFIELDGPRKARRLVVEVLGE